MPNHYIIRVGDGNNFKSSSPVGIWGIRSKYRTFLKNVKEGDILWFIINKRKGATHNGKIIAMATYLSTNKRVSGITSSNEDLHWDAKSRHAWWDTELHYEYLYNVSTCNLFTGQRNQTTICSYDNIKEGLLVNLVVEYENISNKYSTITSQM